MPDGKGIVVATRVIPELAGKLGKDDLAAMKKEIKRRRDSKMSAKVTESRAYRYWDSWLTDNLAHRLVLVDTGSKEFRDLLPGTNFGHPFTLAGSLEFNIAPDGKASR